jgi:hypothetical protein
LAKRAYFATVDAEVRVETRPVETVALQRAARAARRFRKLPQLSVATGRGPPRAARCAAPPHGRAVR